MRLPVFSLSLMLGLVASGPAIATTWESLFYAASGETEARVEMDQQSFEKRLLSGEKVISAHLWLFYREYGTMVQATGDYEIHCAARRVFRSNLRMQAETEDRTENTISIPKKTALAGKEYQDFIGIMNILCAR